MTDLEKAKLALQRPEVSCALCKGDKLYVSEKPGISPMLDWLAEGLELAGFSAADKIVGKAAALLFVRAGLREIYAGVLSRQALPVLEQHDIRYSMGTLAEHIVNRSGDDICPMEKTVTELSDPVAAEVALRKKREELRAGR